jgi:hypothetical protein
MQKPNMRLPVLVGIYLFSGGRGYLLRTSHDLHCEVAENECPMNLCHPTKLFSMECLAVSRFGLFTASVLDTLDPNITASKR